MIFFLHWILRKIKKIIAERFRKERREKTIAEIVWFVFIVVFVISFLKIPNSTLIRYLDLIFIQIYSMINILNYHKEIKTTSKILYTMFSLLLLLMFFFSMLSGMIVESMIKTLSILDLMLMSFVILPTSMNILGFEDFFKVTSNGVLTVITIAAVMFNNDYLLSMDPNRLGWNLRFVAGFQYPSCLGYFSFIVFAVAVYELFFILKRQRKITKKCWPDILRIVVVLILMYLSNTRTAQFISVFFVLFLLYDNLKNMWARQIIKQLTLVLILGLLLALVFSVDFYNLVDNFLSYRLSYSASAATYLTENNSWLTGVGAFRNSSMESLGITVIDNGYLNFIYQYGVITFVVLVAFLGIIYKNVKNKHREEKFGLVYYFYVAFLMYALFENDLLTISNLMAVMVYAACGMRMIKVRKGEK